MDNDLYKSLGRIEEKIDGLVEGFSALDSKVQKHETIIHHVVGAFVFASFVCGGLIALGIDKIKKFVGLI